MSIPIRYVAVVLVGLGLGGAAVYQVQVDGPNATFSSVAEYPFMVAVGQLDENHGFVLECGGVLIDPEWILTAAHCRRTKHAIAGSNDTNSPCPSCVLAVNARWCHPDYVKAGGASGPGQHDIALLKLAQPFSTADAKPLSPSSQSTPGLESEGTPVTVAGWGWHEMEQGRFATSVVQTIKKSECRTAISDRVVDESTFCTEEGIGPRLNDSGGPALVGGTGSWTQVGIINSGEDGQLPRVYAKLSFYRPWIKDVMQNPSQHAEPCEK